MSYKDFEQLTGAQHGVITRSQGVQLLGRGAFDQRVRNGTLIPVHRAVYRFSGTPLLRSGEIHAAVLAAPPGAVASHTTALELFQLIPWQLGRTCHVTVEPKQSLRLPGVTVHKSPTAMQYRSIREGIPTVDLARALIDSAAKLQERFLGDC